MTCFHSWIYKTSFNTLITNVIKKQKCINKIIFASKLLFKEIWYANKNFFSHFSREFTKADKKVFAIVFWRTTKTMNISYTVLSRQSTIIGTFEDLFRLFLSVVVGLFLFGNGDEQKEFGNGDILDELDDEVEGVDEFP